MLLWHCVHQTCKFVPTCNRHIMASFDLGDDIAEAEEANFPSSVQSFFWFCLWCAPSVLAGHRCHGRGGESYGPAEPHFGGGSDHTTDKIIIHFCQYPHRSAELTMCKLKRTFYIVFK